MLPEKNPSSVKGNFEDEIDFKNILVSVRYLQNLIAVWNVINSFQIIAMYIDQYNFICCFASVGSMTQ